MNRENEKIIKKEPRGNVAQRQILFFTVYHKYDDKTINASCLGVKYMIVKENKGHFAKIPCVMLDDPRLKPVDIYIMSYLLSCDQTWKVRQIYISKRLRVSLDVVKRSFKRLKAAGYAEYKQERAAGGEWGKGDWIIYDTSQVPIDGADEKEEAESGWTF